MHPLPCGTNDCGPKLMYKRTRVCLYMCWACGTAVLHQEQLHRASDHRTQRWINPLVTHLDQQFRPVTLAVWETSTRSRVEMCVRWFYSPMASSETDFPWQFLVFWPRKAKAETLFASKESLHDVERMVKFSMLWNIPSNTVWNKRPQVLNYQFSLPKCWLFYYYYYYILYFSC